MQYDTEKDLLDKARSLKGKRIVDFYRGKFNQENKGSIGLIIEEHWFGVKNNNDQQPDFPNLGIELKVLPMKRLSNRQLTVKERTKICSIDYVKLVDEQWKQSNARKKLNKILFVFYEYVAENPLDSKVLEYHLFTLSSNDEPLIRSDWERTKDYVKKGFAHQLSESQNVVLAASRAGEGNSAGVPQPVKRHSASAAKRAFSLKSSYTKTIWEEVKRGKELDRIVAPKPFTDTSDIEKYVLDRLNGWKGKTLERFASVHAIPSIKGKHASALVIRRALGLTTGTGPVKELMQAGLTVKTIPCRSSDLTPFEAMSFPHQPLAEILQEDDFYQSEFHSHLQGFIFIPLLRKTQKSSRPVDITFGKSFIWRPDRHQLEQIGREWRRCKEIITKGIVVKRKTAKNRKGYTLTNNLPGAKNTQYIHMRPHGRNSDDVDMSISIDNSIDTRITKQCFWLNKSFVRGLVVEHNSK